MNMDQAENLRKIVTQNDPVTSLSPVVSPTQIIAVTSGKGGVGKTFVSVNLAMQLAKQGKKAVIMDADFGLANVEVMLGIRPQYNLADLIYKDKNIDDIITEGPLGVGFISGGSGVDALTNLDSEQIRVLITKLVQLDSLADVIIIDTGAGISESVLEFVLFSPETILVITPEPTSITDAYSLLKVLNRKKNFISEEKTIHILANQVQSESEGLELFEKLNVVVTKFLNISLDYVGSVMRDSLVPKSIMEQTPISLAYPNAVSVKSFHNIMTRFGIMPEEESKEGFARFFANIIKGKIKIGGE